ncbi:MAG: hypothetical protein NTV51_30220 [Verrucomicrobia bacterium]|nr:hypothetical protein [Verrucomicrobiota bacterium]
MSSINQLHRNPGQDAYGLSSASPSPRRGLNQLIASAPDGSADPSAALSVAATFSPSSRRLAAGLPTPDPAASPASPVGALKHAAGLLARIGELKSLHDDASASDEDRATYQDEFSQLQQQLTALGLDVFQGQPRSVGTKPSPLQVSEPSADTPADAITAADPGPLEFTDDFSSAANWTSASGELSVSDHTLYPNANGGFGSIQSQQSFSGAMEIKFDLYLPGANDSLDLSLGDTKLSNLTDSTNISKWGWHSVRIAYDGAGNAATYLDGSDTAADTQSGLAPASGQLGLANLGEGSARLRNFSLQGTVVVPPVLDDETTESSGADASESPADTDAPDLATLDAGAIAAAQDNLAAQQAEADAAAIPSDPAPLSGADPLTAAAASIADAADAGEITRLIRESMLLESGLALSSQANVNPESALQLLGTE